MGSTNHDTAADAVTSAQAHSAAYSIAPELLPFNVHFSEYKRSSPSFAHHAPDALLAAVTGAVVLHRQPDTDSSIHETSNSNTNRNKESSTTRILLVQRAPTDSMPLKWETPGGAYDDSDATLLAGAARELHEETGLCAVRMVRLLAEYTWVHRRVGLITKWVFEVEVAGEGEDEGEGDRRRGEAPVVRLDPAEHCAFVWATREEVECGRHGEIELEFTSETVRNYVLAALD